MLLRWSLIFNKDLEAYTPLTMSCYQQLVSPTLLTCLRGVFLNFSIKTDSHGGPGGYHQFVLYDFTCLGFIADSYNALVNGITQSVVNAHNSMFTGRIFVTETDVNDVGVNRSPKSYLENPAAERARFNGDIDRTMTQVRFVDSQNQVRGAFSWLASELISLLFVARFSVYFLQFMPHQ